MLKQNREISFSKRFFEHFIYLSRTRSASHLSLGQQRYRIIQWPSGQELNPPRTNFVKDAEARGCKVLDGLGMLVNQGITGIEYWTGMTVDGVVMRTHLEELFGA